MNNFQEYCFYLLFIFFEFVLLFIGKNGKKPVFTYLAIIVAITISGLRTGVGADYFIYERNYEYINEFNDLKNYPNLEPLYLLSNYVFKQFGIPFNGLLLFFSSITIIPLFSGIKKISPNPEFSFFLFIITNYYFVSMNQLRQVIALSLFIFSLFYFTNKSKHKFLFINTIGVLFHYSAIITYTILFVDKISKFLNKRILIILLVTSLALGGFIEPFIIKISGLFLPPFYIDYLLSDFFLEKNFIAFFKLIFPSIIFIISIFYWPIIKNKANFNLVFLLFSIGIFYFNIFFGKSIFIRPGFYFDICIIVWIPMLGSMMTIIKRNILYATSTFYYISLLWLTIFINGGQGVVPYNSILF